MFQTMGKDRKEGRILEFQTLVKEVNATHPDEGYCYCFLANYVKTVTRTL